MDVKTKAIEMYKRYPLSTWITVSIGGIIVLIFIFFAAFAEFLSPYDPLAISNMKLAPLSSIHLMGTDQLGRDIFSRTLHGARFSISVALLSVGISSIAGSFFGLLCSYIGGKLDKIVTIPMDAIYSFPPLLMALVIAIVLGPGVVNTAVAVAVPWVPLFYRVSRSITLSIKESLLIEVQRSLGSGELRIIIHHVLPRCVPSLAVLTSMGVVRAVLSVTALGFLGAGIPPPTPEWGSDLALGRLVLTSGVWWPITFPGLFMFIFVLALNQFGEGMNVMLNPMYRVR